MIHLISLTLYPRDTLLPDMYRLNRTPPLHPPTVSLSERLLCLSVLESFDRSRDPTRVAGAYKNGIII